MDGKAWLHPILGDEMVAARATLKLADVVFVKGIFEASEGLGAVFAEPKVFGAPHDGGALVLAAPRSREAELRCLIRDLAVEIPELGSVLWETGGERNLERPDDPCPW